MPVNEKYRDAFPDPKHAQVALHMLLRLHGGPKCALASKATYEPLAILFDLSREARRLTRQEYYVGDKKEGSAWENLLQWARRGLADAGDLAESARGVWCLSEQGQKSADREIERNAALAAKIRALHVR